MEQHLELPISVIASDVTVEAMQQSFEITALILSPQTGDLI